MRGKLVLTATALAALALPCRAAERVSLTNGFALTCAHHETVEGRVRLYSSANASSYIEFPPADIASIETVPDPPPSAEPETAESTPAARPTTPAKLTPADLHEMLATAGQAHHLDVDLLASVVKAESGGNPRAKSRAGAKGLMQLMDGTASDLGVHDSYKPEDNVRGGSAYLDGLLTRYHDNLALALAAYNAGPAAVDKYRGIPPYRETRLYVARVIHEFNRRVIARQRLAQQEANSSSQASAGR
ncbi:lytic transglycosylase domain-containing protein [Occallatibacter riparius]|uniref:Lytic transglycosylase domain-containing protein n=1 Tax=Occallatibacter riparius TaxID=1002689 RepID=A0A9J7BWN5_9BACT|nr:lytic transglycosylase domain-containing protein [Occallatibacter riparius]